MMRWLSEALGIAKAPQRARWYPPEGECEWIQKWAYFMEVRGTKNGRHYDAKVYDRDEEVFLFDAETGEVPVDWPPDQAADAEWLVNECHRAQRRAYAAERRGDVRWVGQRNPRTLE